MSFLKRAIQQGISKGIGDAVGSAVKKALEPTATQWANKTAQQLDQMADKQTQQASQNISGLEGAFSNLQRAAENYATEVSKKVKLCPGCGEAVDAEKKFCPSCGAKLPETTAADSALCPACGKQNAVGSKFCDGCGAKLPGAIAEEAAAQKKIEEALLQWDSCLSMYPKWCCGGTGLYIEQYDPAECNGYFASITVDFPRGTSGSSALAQYQQVLRDAGFRPAGRYPSQEHLYKKIGDTCYLASAEHAFEGGMDNLTLEFAVKEPDGGFDYVKPEPKPQSSWKDLVGLDVKKEMNELKGGLKDLKNMFRR